MRKLAHPAPVILLLAPFVAEYLLGDLGVGQLWLFPLMLPIYGGGALLVREAARRMRRGWPTMIMLGLSYGIVEEALATQSLFNPHYLGLRLIDFGYLPALGIAGPWTTYVLTIHAVWSIAVPIALTEALFAGRRGEPWLGRAGTAAAGVLYAAGVAIVALGTFKQEHFMASGTQLAAGALGAAAVAAAAFLLFRPANTIRAAPAGALAGGTRPAWLAGLTAFAGGSLFMLMTRLESVLPPAALVAAQCAVAGISLATLARLARARGWTDRCADAAGAGALLVYCWWGFTVTRSLHGRAGLAGHCLIAAIALAVLALIRAGRRAPPAS